MKLSYIIALTASIAFLSSCRTTNGIRTYIQGIPQFQTIVRLYPDSTFSIHTDTHLGGVNTVAKGRWLTQGGRTYFSIDTNINVNRGLEWMPPSYQKYMYIEDQNWHLNKTELKSDSGDLFISKCRFMRNFK